MKLESLYSRSNVDVLREYLSKLRKLKEEFERPVLNEAKITITIDDQDNKYNVGIPIDARQKFVEQAKNIGNFGDNEWVEQLVNGMKQVGVQGFNNLCEEDKPATNKDIKALVGLLVDLVNSK